MSAQKPDIVILGGGFGGVTTAKKILRRLEGNYKLTIIDKKDFHDYHPQLYDIASAWIPKNNPKKIDYLNIEGTVAFPFSKIFAGKDVNFIVDTVVNIDAKNKTIRLSENKDIIFDYLVIALGSETNYFGIEGLEENSLSFKNVEEALNVRNEIVEAFYNHQEGKEINIVIGGGGFSGCELAAELKSFVHLLCQEHSVPESKVTITIVEACETVLQGAKKWSQERAYSRLKHLDVKVLTSSVIDGVGNKEIKIKGGATIKFSILIWTAGIKANSLMSKLAGFELGKGGCLINDEFLRIKSFENIYSVGDNAFCFDVKHNCPVPPTAQKAIHEGKTVAINICNQINNKPLLVHNPELPSFAIPLGSKFALVTIGNLFIEGYIGWVVRELISLKYFTTLLPLNEAVVWWWKGVRIFIRNDVEKINEKERIVV